MTLREIITRKWKFPFLLIADSYEADGFSLLIAVIQSLVDKKCTIQFLCMENPVSTFRDSVRIVGDVKINYIDCFNDHLGWLGQKKVGNYKCEIEKVLCTPMENSVLVIDSLASMVVNLSSATVYKLIHQFIVSSKSKECRMVGLLHQDLVDGIEFSEICHLAGTALRILPPIPNTHSRLRCYIQQKTIKGNQSGRMEHYSVDSCNMIWSEPYRETIKRTPSEPVDSMNDVTTFKLSLDEKEKEARGQLVLPYLRKEPEKVSTSSGVIHYQPDDMDDWDEEDPDNDLNI